MEFQPPLSTFHNREAGRGLLPLGSPAQTKLKPVHAPGLLGGPVPEPTATAPALRAPQA